ncbi:MAG: hypothetical protein R3239_00155 [Thermodesulfobacteriota bacterium]|nr:hypothetical protein [Thermodesulfobacteriota bacterium]
MPGDSPGRLHAAEAGECQEQGLRTCRYRRTIPLLLTVKVGGHSIEGLHELARLAEA